MKKILLIAVVAALVFTMLAGCVGGTNQQSAEPQEAAEAPQQEQPAAEQQSEPEAQEAPQEDAGNADEMQYAFEFKDLEGNTHKLSDYAGKPVYLKVWASWCGVCVSSLPETNEMSGSVEDYTVLTVITPNQSGEKSLEDFKTWYAEQEDTENIVVLVDEEGQIISDFGVAAFPSQVFFDTNGNFSGGRIGLMAKDLIDAEMAKLG
jgi:thiol-disulfide isomerase/thioredoxin